MIKVTNLAEFDADVMAWFAAVEEAAAEAAVGLAKIAFHNLLIESPQYSGDFAANWRVSVGTISAGFTENAVGGVGALGDKAFQRGSPRAIAYAMGHAEWPRIQLGQTIVLHNSAAHTEPYAMKIEEGSIVFRDVNSGADHVVRRTAMKVGFDYESITSQKLKGLRSFGK